MKIQDIFKLNLNDRGGVKLFNKIMGRYNIPKADSKELINEVQNSSSGDGGVKEYYYKVLAPDDQLNNLTPLLHYIGCHSCLVEIRKYIQGVWQIVGVTDIGFNLGITKGYLGYIKLIDSYTSIMNGTNDFGYLIDILPYYPVGDIHTRLKNYGKYQMGDSWDDSMLEQMEPKFQEITKEEYESLITYKP